MQRVLRSSVRHWVPALALLSQVWGQLLAHLWEQLMEQLWVQLMAQSFL